MRLQGLPFSSKKSVSELALFPSKKEGFQALEGSSSLPDVGNL